MRTGTAPESKQLSLAWPHYGRSFLFFLYTLDAYRRLVFDLISRSSVRLAVL